jgi:hypothetical protein
MCFWSIAIMWYAEVIEFLPTFGSLWQFRFARHHFTYPSVHFCSLLVVLVFVISDQLIADLITALRSEVYSFTCLLWGWYGDFVHFSPSAGPVSCGKHSSIFLLIIEAVIMFFTWQGCHKLNLCCMFTLSLNKPQIPTEWRCDLAQIGLYFELHFGFYIALKICMQLAEMFFWNVLWFESCACHTQEYALWYFPC